MTRSICDNENSDNETSTNKNEKINIRPEKNIQNKEKKSIC